MKRHCVAILFAALTYGCSDAPTSTQTADAPSPSAARWSDPASWPGGQVPTAGATVVIDSSRSLALDVSPPPLAGLRVDGTLRFANTDLSLTSDWIVVNGRLEIGREGQPHTARATITLTGSNPDDDLFGFGSKLLAVRGTLELHGERRVSWTRLAATARRGSTSLTLERPVDWRPGDRIVLASTDFDPGQAEELVVRSVSGTTVNVETALRFTHWGESQSIGGARLDERAEVGLLSRNIVIRGDDSSPANGYGGHIIVFSSAIARVEGVELHRMGQRGKLARYPFHWHMAGDVSGQYARSNSVWGSFNRCITVHGTHAALVEDNVCYDNMGHAYFLEDGIEARNTLARNLGVLTRAPAEPHRLLASDARPATFWISNPDNTIVGNASAGSRGFGFWYALPVNPTGLSTTTSVWPRRTTLREFSDNVAHSNILAGLNVDDGPNPDGTTATASYTPRQDPSSASSPAVVANFRNFVAYKHGSRAVWLRGNSLRLTSSILADNVIGATFAANETFLENSTVIGKSANSETPFPGTTPIRGYEFYDGRVGSQNVTFVNFVREGTREFSAISFLRNNPYPFASSNFAGAVSFVNAKPFFVDLPRADRDGSKNAVFLDRDGAVTGGSGQYVVAATPALHTSSCVARTDWNAYVCPHSYGALNVSAAGDNVAPLDVVRDDGVALSLVGNGGNPMSTTAAAIIGRRYVVRPVNNATPRLIVSLSRVTQGDAIVVGVPASSAPQSVLRDGAIAMIAAPSLADVEAGSGDRFFSDAAAGLIWVKLTPRAGRDAASVTLVR